MQIRVPETRFLPIQTGLDLRNKRHWPNKIRKNSGNIEAGMLIELPTTHCCRTFTSLILKITNLYSNKLNKKYIPFSYLTLFKAKFKFYN